ncbi:mucin-19-like isoform X2 [Anopheles aquasalis]|uniref:mucin-19-like isoform X2 n=1 Tax=Anopheles aquasalis TaxID=42839 RepID=UPI00215A4BF6|nr:mucin-19-like isoform X2 [Anopheles aquasalis]
MGAGTFATSLGSPGGPGLLRRRYSVPEIIMRKHTLAQQKSSDEALLLHDTNHNVIDVVNKNVLAGRLSRPYGSPGIGSGSKSRLTGGSTPMTPHRKSLALRRTATGAMTVSRTEPGTRSSSVESGIGVIGTTTTNGEWGPCPAVGSLLLNSPPTMATQACLETKRAMLAMATGGSDPNLVASLRKQKQLYRGSGTATGMGPCSPLCNGIGSSRALAAGTGGSLRCINNNNINNSLSGSSSSINGIGGLAGGPAAGGVGGTLGGIGCGHGGSIVGMALRDGDYSMRKTTLLRRMWSRELRRSERSGSWSPPARRPPRRIYSIESIAPASEGHHRSMGSEGGATTSRPSSSGSSCSSSHSSTSVAARECATTTTTTAATSTPPGTAGSCAECAKLERQYLGGFAADQSGSQPVQQLANDTLCFGEQHRAVDHRIGNGGEQVVVRRVVPATDPTTVDDRLHQRRMCSSQPADLGARDVVVPNPQQQSPSTSPVHTVVVAAAAAASAPPPATGSSTTESVLVELEGDGGADDLDELSVSSSISSIASQSYRVTSSRVLDNESELSEFLQQERLATGGGEPVGVATTNDGRGVEAWSSGETVGHGARLGPGHTGASDHPRERAPADGGSAGAPAGRPTDPPIIGRSEPTSNQSNGRTTVDTECEDLHRSASDGDENNDDEDDEEDSSGALSALSEDSGSESADGSDHGRDNDTVTNQDSEVPLVKKADAGGKLDEYISNLLQDNLNNHNEVKEVLPTATDTVEQRGDKEPELEVLAADRQNNNNGGDGGHSESRGPSRAPSASTMKQKLTGKYIGGGGGVVCNSPPTDKRKSCSPSLPVDDEGHDRPDGDGVDKENEEDAVNNNNQNNNRRESRAAKGEEEADERHRLRHRQKDLLTDLQHQQERHPSGKKNRTKPGNGFYLVQPRKDTGRDSLAAQFDLNGKYYFPSYGLETDPSDNTDVASEPEATVLSKVGTGSTYGGESTTGLARSVVVPRFSAMPRTESMEVQPSSNTSAEDEYDDPRSGSRRPRDGDVSDSDDSLVDSLDGFDASSITKVAARGKRKDSKATAVPPERTTDSMTASSADKSPRHEKGEAFFVPIQDSARLKLIDERVIVADTMPLKIKERLNNRRRMMKWKQEQENLKKQRKMKRMIEQKRFYGEPAIQVISTIDKSISRKEFIPPEIKKTVFGARGAEAAGSAGPTPFRAMKPKKRATEGAALRTELGMLESYKIDGKGNMQIQTPSTTTERGAAAGTGPAASGRKAAQPQAKSPWGMTAERRQSKPTGASSSGAPTTASSTLPSTRGRTGGGRTPAVDKVRRKQVLKDVQQMTLYPQADLTPDIEGGPRRMYQKTEIQEGDKHIEILEIVECADSAPRSVRSSSRPSVRVRSAGHGGRHGGSGGSKSNRSRIPVPVYRFGQYRRSNHSREGSPLSGMNPKIDRMIADLLLQALSNPDEGGVKFVKTPENLRDTSKSSKRSSTGAGGSSKKEKKGSQGSAPGGGGNSSSTGGASSNTLATPRRTASGKYTQKFEVIPEERSSVSIDSSTEELSSSLARKKAHHASPRRVSFDENHQILNVDELLESAKTSAGSSPLVSAVTTPVHTGKLAVPSPSKQSASPKLQSPVASPRKVALASPAKSPHKVAPRKGTGAVTTASANNTTISRGKAAIQSDVIEERGWIGFSTQHEDMATPVNGHDDEDTESFVTDSLNTKASPPIRSYYATNQPRLTQQECGERGLDRHQLVATATTPPPPPPPVTTVVENRQTVRSCHRTGHNMDCDLKSTADSVKEVTPQHLVAGVYDSDLVLSYHHPHSSPSSPPPYHHQIREENAWHVYQTGDCKVIQSKIEYYETSIHRTPVTTGGTHHHHQHQHHYSGSGGRSDLFGPLVEHGRSPDSLLRGLSTADSLEVAASQQRGQLMASLLTPGRNHCGTGLSSAEPPKTSETTCSSCCFCNPELHRANGAGTVRIPPETCFYCHAKTQSPSKAFPAPPTPPNIQTSPVPPSPQTPIVELTPTPSLLDIKPPKAHSTGTGSVTSTKVTSTTTAMTNGGSDNRAAGGLVAETTKKTDHTHTKIKAKATDTVSTRCTRTNEKIKRSYQPPQTATTGSSSAATHPTASSGGPTGHSTVISSTAQPSTGGGQKPSSTSTAATLTPKLARKKSESSVLNRPKHTNHLVRASTVVHSVQKEVKNELKAPIKVLPKTAKELNNRKEKERQISLNLPLAPTAIEQQQKPAIVSSQKVSVPTSFMAGPVSVGPPMVHSVTAVTVDDRCASASQSYDEGTSSGSSTANSTPDTSPNSSPFKKCTGATGVPTAASRWKTNSERNLSQLSIQKMVSASKWGSKWRKAHASRDALDQEHQMGDEMEGVRGRSAAGGGCSELSPVKTFKPDAEAVGTALGDMAAGRGTGVGLSGTDTMATAGSANLINGITQTATNQGWTVTVAGNYNPEMAPDVEMRLSFPKGGGSTTASNALTGMNSGKTHLTGSSAMTANHLQQDTSSSTGYSMSRHRQPYHQEAGARTPNYGGFDQELGGSRNASRAAALPPPGGLNPKRNLTRSDGTGATAVGGGGGSTGKDYRLPNVGPAHNVMARPTAKKAIKTVECSVVASATRTIANNYHQLSHQHQMVNEPAQQHHGTSRGLAAGAGLRASRSRPK